MENFQLFCDLKLGSRSHVGRLAACVCVCAGTMENVFGVTVHVHPVALMAIVDSHERRAEGSKRAVGTLVGVKEKRGVVVIRNAYPVPHNETEELVLWSMTV